MPEQSKNTLSDLIKFFEVETKEFKEFWDGLNDEERLYYKSADLS